MSADTRPEVVGFFAGVQWLLEYDRTHPHAAPEEISVACRIEAAKLWPPFDPLPPPDLKGKRTGL